VPAILGRSYPSQILEITEDLPPAEIALLAYGLPPPGGADHWALEVLHQLLGGGSVDRFGDSIADRRRKAIYGGTLWLQARRGGGVVFNAGFVPYRRRATAFRMMDQAVDELARLEWLTDDSLASAKKTLMRREMERVYFAHRRAEALGRARWWLGDERLAFDGAERIAEVNRDQVTAVFNRYISNARPVRLYIKPEHVPLWVRLFGWVYPLVGS
jgi:predicted Zn-dependent peptidase